MSFASPRFRHPAFLAFLCAAAQFALVVLILLGGRSVLPETSFQAVKLTAFATTVLLPVVLAQMLGLWRSIGLGWGGLRPGAALALGLLPTVPFLIFGLHLPAAANVASDLVIQSFNAFGEELLFRGVIFLILLRLSPVRSVVLNGLLFGAMHLIHGFMDGDWSAALVQSAVSTVAGMMFTALRYRTQSLWPPIIVHLLLNLAIMYSNVEPAAGATAYFAVKRLADLMELGITFYLMRSIVGAPATDPVALKATVGG